MGGSRARIIQTNDRLIVLEMQLLIFGACSAIVLVTMPALCRKSKPPPSVSYGQQQLQMASSSQQGQLARQQAADFDQVTNSAHYTPPLSQPSIYHSIIDRTEASARPASPAVQTSTSAFGDLNTAAGHHHGHAHGKYYEYRSVPKKKTWKFGYKRGNHKHTISRHEHGKAGKHPHFKTKVKWHDKKSKGKGIHLWDYNHHDKKHYHHG